MSNKFTKKDYFAQILEILGDTKPELTDFVNKEVAALDAKAAKAKERAAAKKAAPDALADAVVGVLTSEPLTIDEIVALVTDVEGATRNRVVARLTKLKDLGVVAKVDGKPVKYRLAD